MNLASRSSLLLLALLAACAGGQTAPSGAPAAPPLQAAPAVVDAGAPTSSGPASATTSQPSPRPTAFARSRVLAPRLPQGFALTADAAHVYGVAHGGGGAFRVPLSGGPVELLASEPTGARDVAVDAATLYWTKGHGPSPGGAVFAMPKAGGPVRELAPHEADAHLVALDGSFVYWANGGGYDESGRAGDAEIRRMPKQGGPIATLTTVASVMRLVVAGDELFLLASGATQFTAGIVAKMPKSGGAITTLAPSGANPADLDVDETHVYWTSRGDFEMPRQAPCKSKLPCPIATTAPIVPHGALLRVPRAGGAAEVLASELRDAGALVVGQTSILFGAGGQIVERSKAGGPLTARGQGWPSRFVVVGGEALALAPGGLVAFGP